MKEIDFYEEFAEKFLKYLKGYLDESFQLAYSHNKSLDSMINELCKALKISNPFPNEYIPKLKLDILFGIKKNDKIHFILFEAKYLTQLSLKDYSQLTGYLQVAKNIGTGLLLLIVRGSSTSKLSSDFNEILRLNKLPMDWKIIVNNQSYEFKSGIITYLPDNGINWIDTNNVNGISDFEEFAEIVKNNLQ